MKILYTLAFLTMLWVSSSAQFNLQIVDLGGNMVEVQIQANSPRGDACTETWGAFSYALSWDTVRVSDVTPVNGAGCGDGLAFDTDDSANGLGETAPGRIGRLYNCTQFNPNPGPYPFAIPQAPDWVSAGKFMLTLTGNTDEVTQENLVKIVGPNEVMNSMNSNVGTNWLPAAFLFAPFNPAPTFAIAQYALPLTMVSFEANKKGSQSVSLTWKTVDETNVSHFVVERSRDGKEWEDIGSVQAAGETTAETTYDFVDKNVYNGRSALARYYYRLRILDNDATEANTGIEAVIFRGNGPEAEVYVYPNPSSIGLNVEFNAEDRIPSRMEMFDASGKIVYSTVLPEGTEIEFINYGTLSITSGTYILRVLDEKEEVISADKIIVSR